MITIRPDLKVLVAAQPVDFRKGMDALAGLVAERLRENPMREPSSSSAPSEPIA